MLRVSLTDRCNLRCTYCMPADGLDWLPERNLLSFDEIAEVVRAAAAVGIGRIKLTGGEPTVRARIVDLVRQLRAIPGVTEISLTTNGLLLPRLALPLRRAGLDRVTISIDSLQPERFRHITRNGELSRVLDGLDACERAGFGGLKINCVAMRGINDDEFGDLARLALARALTVRFIEYMPLGESAIAPPGASAERPFVSESEIRRTIEQTCGPLRPIARCRDAGVGPSTVYEFCDRDAPGRIGFISAMSAPFCSTCNRIRLTADGRLCSCLFDGGEVDVRHVLRDPLASAADRQRSILRAMKRCVEIKPDSHAAHGCMQMSRAGG
jgi:cyclic pyranopterin phosphate synthase